MLLAETPDGPAFLSITGLQDVEGKIRVRGDWVFPEKIFPYVHGEDSDTLSNVSQHVLNSLICAGINSNRWNNVNSHGRNAKSPSDFQLLPMDLLRTPWLNEILPEKYPRTRLLIADEGGLGKTFSASFAIADTFLDNEDAIILILCPPLLRNKWAEEIRLCMPHKAGKIHNLRSAQTINQNLNPGVYVTSKYSFRKQHSRMINSGNLSWIPDIELLVIDEIHQGNITANTDMFASLKEISSRSNRVIGLSASPINNGVSDFLRNIELMGGELSNLVPYYDDFFSRTNWENLWADWNSKINHALDLIQNGGSIDDFRQWVNSSVSSLQILFDWMDAAELTEFLDNFRNLAPTIIYDNIDGKGYKLLRELHPLGRFFSLVQRSDLGPVGAQIFRDRIDEYHRIELSQDHLNLIDQVQGQSKTILSSWAENIHYYDSISITNPSIPSVDPRWDFVITELDKELGLLVNNIGNNECRGAVIFVDWIGTLKGMKTKLEEHFNGHSEVEIFCIQGAGNDNDGYSRNSKALARVKEARKISKSGKFPILICTSAVEVGVDMEFATLGVMWDIKTNPETLSQRTWRLDRRYSATSGVCKDFRIIHIQNSFNDSIIQRLNTRHSTSTAILGRITGTFIPLLNPNEEEKIARQWPNEAGVFALSSEESQLLRSRFNLSINSQITDIQKELDILFWLWCSGLVDLPIDTDRLLDGFLTLDDETFIDEDCSNGIQDWAMKIIWDIASISSETEMSLLWNLSGTPITVDPDLSTLNRKHSFGLRFANPGYSHQHSICSINREGNISNKLRHILIESCGNILTFGDKSPYLCWHREAKADDGVSVLIEQEWFELWISNRELMVELGAKSPLLIQKNNIIDFLYPNSTNDHIIIDIVESSISQYIDTTPIDILYFGKTSSDEMLNGELWPNIDDNTINDTEQKIIQMKDSLINQLTIISSQPTVQQQNLYASLIEYNFSRDKIIPMIYCEEV